VSGINNGTDARGVGSLIHARCGSSSGVVYSGYVPIGAMMRYGLALDVVGFVISARDLHSQPPRLDR
jgi:hypothetical protein